MRKFQIIITIITALMMVGVLAVSAVVNSSISNTAADPGCFFPIVIITTVLVFITSITVFIRK